MTEETRELIITGSGEPVVDWDAGPGVQSADEYMISATASPRFQPRSKWDFTDGQRIVIGILIWLNIIVLVIGYLALTGQLAL